MSGASDRLAQLVVTLRAAADPDRSGPMAAYMKGIAPFFGVPAPQRRVIQREVFAGWNPDERDAIEFATGAWRVDERELQYAGCDLLERTVQRASAELLPTLEQLITTKSWWDTVDALARSVGGLVLRYPDLGNEMDRWIGSDDIWVARVAIIHQLRFKTATNADRLFGYCERRASDTEFFVRKAIGWALREYAKTDPNAVREFVTTHERSLSGLSKREALKHL